MTGQPLILLIDDEPNFLEIFKTKFSAIGFGVETALNGEEGIKKAKALKPDLILLDMKMPGLSGADVLIKLRDDKATKGIKVMFLTNLGDPRPEMNEVSERISIEVGAHGYIRKTDDLDSIVERVKDFLLEKKQ